MGSRAFQVNFGHEIGPRTFETLDEFKKWVDAESDFWQWLNAVTLPSPLSSIANIHHVINPQIAPQTNLPCQHYNQMIAELRRVISEATPRVSQKVNSIEEEAFFASWTGTINNTIERWYITASTLHSSDARAKYVMELKNKSDVAALFALAFFCRINLLPFGHDAQNGATLAACFEQGIFNRIPEDNLALKEIVGNAQKTLAEFNQALIKETENHKKLNSDATALMTDQRAELATLLENHRKEWTALKHTYNEELALQSPVRYWTERARRHFWGQIWFGLLSLFVGACVFIFIFNEIDHLLGNKNPTTAPEKILDKMTVGDPNKPEYWRLAMLLLIGSIGVWFLRIIVRLFFTQAHLHNDAKERVTMVRTYLALLRRGKVILTEDRNFILQALFRPALSSSVKEPRMPLVSMEAISKPKS
jgi:hypothetical protein